MIRAVIGGRNLDVLQGDITEEDVDAVVTAANSGLRGGGGVDGAIHRAAGPTLLQACREIGGCPTGEAVATHAGELSATRVIHAVGPVFGQNDGRDDELLASAHRRALEVAAEEGCASIAFPAISCGVYGFPVPRAAHVAMSTIADYLASEDAAIDDVRYVLFGRREYDAFARALRDLAASREDVVLDDDDGAAG